MVLIVYYHCQLAKMKITEEIVDNAETHKPRGGL